MAALRAVSIEQDSGLDELWNWPGPRLQRTLGWPDSVMASLYRYRSSLGLSPDLTVPVDVLLPMDPNWPTSLNRLERPPVALYRQGDDGLLPSLAKRLAIIAVVGMRAASSHGLQMAEQLGRSLAGAGWPVVSGLAEGIDAAVHRGCLSAGGSPVAVLGTPLSRTYPSHHIALQESVGLRGCCSLSSGQVNAFNRAISQHGTGCLWPWLRRWWSWSVRSAVER